jgi:hypothetical protein
MPKARAADYAAEVFGVMKHDFSSFLPGKLIDACFLHKGLLSTPPETLNDEPLTVWVGVDLAGHSRSELGLCALVGAGGKIVVIGGASVAVDACQMVELQTIVRAFVARLREHPWVRKGSILVPVIECNLNEVMALSLRVVFEQSKPYFMPFTKTNFSKFVTDGVGVWTTEDTKMASIQCAYQALLDNQLAASEPFVTVGRDAFDFRAKATEPMAALLLLRTQLGQFAYDDKGKISGKTSEGNNDDLAMAFLLAIYWRLCVMSHDNEVR